MADEILVLILNTTRATLSFTVCVCVFAYRVLLPPHIHSNSPQAAAIYSISESRIATMSSSLERGF